MASNSRTVRSARADGSPTMNIPAPQTNALGWQPLRTAGSPPLVEQLVQHCQQLLGSHSLRAGTRMPSVRQLADSAGVSRDTVV